jgi:hypothetical protein
LLTVFVNRQARDGLPAFQIFRVKFPKKNLIPGLPKVILSEEKKPGETTSSRKVTLLPRNHSPVVRKNHFSGQSFQGLHKNHFSEQS